MDNVQLRYVFDRLKQSTNGTKKGPLQIEVRQSGTNIKKLISTGVHLYKNQFSDKNGFTCKNHDNAPAITGKVTRMFRQIEAFVLSDQCNGLHDVPNWNREESEFYSVVEFMRNSLRRRNPSAAVLEYHNTLIRKIEDFGRIKVFSDITYENIVEFDLFLRRTIKSQPTLYKRHCAFKSYIVDAINRGLCNFNPYVQFRVQKGKSRQPTFLDEAEIKMIREYAPVNEKLQKVKDLFIFQCFTGMAFVDVMNFSRSEVSEADGMKIIRSSRRKTDESFVSLFLPEAEEIAEKMEIIICASRQGSSQTPD